MKQIKCANCGEWNNGEVESCKNCGHIFYEDRKRELENRKGEGENVMRMVQIKEEDGFWQKAWKHPVRIGQLIFFSIISVIAAIASSTVH